MMESPKSVVVKVVLLGESSVGKTCTVLRYVKGTFSDQHEVTLGANFFAKDLQIGDHVLNLQLWDTAGQEKYRTLTRMYYRGAKVALIFYDVTSRDSFEGKVEEWVKDVRSKASDDVNIIIVGNKIDKSGERKVSTEEGWLCAEKFGLPFFEVSAKDGICVDELFIKLGKMVVENNPDMLDGSGKGGSEDDMENVMLGPPEEKKRSGCC